MVRPIHFFSIALMFLSSAFALAVDFAGGTGEPNDPYQIATAEQLIGLGEDPNLYGRHFRMVADVDLNPNLPGRLVFEGAVIAPFDCTRNGPASQCKSFTGSFDGDNHIIRHLTLSGPAYAGMFGQTGARAKIRNLKLEDVDIDGGNRTGSLVGYNNGAHIVGCSSSGIVVGTDAVGGLIGSHREGSVTRCSSSSNVMGDSTSGGLIGSMSSGRLWNCFSVGPVSGGSILGGLIGEVSSGTLENCFSAGVVDGESSVGGLIGRCASQKGRGSLIPVDVLLCYSTGLVRGSRYVGGLVGDGAVHALNSFWDKQRSEQGQSVAGVGYTSQAMQTLSTYTQAGWDFCGEHANGTSDWWCMPVDGGYPQLAAFADENSPPLLGEGTAESPYLVADAHDLGKVSQHGEPGAYYELVSDVDLSGTHWLVAVIPEFVGRFDGKGYTLSNLKITGKTPLGLFGCVHADASVKNILLDQIEVTGTDDVGALAGLSHGTIDNCFAVGQIRGSRRVGGLVGTNHLGVLFNCRSRGDVTGYQAVGGLVGDNAAGGIRNSAGVAGVEGNTSIGGLVGHNGGHVSRCFADGFVRGSENPIGGLVGSNRGTLLDSYATSSVAGGCAIGGLVGYNYSRVLRCYSAGPIRGDCVAGGLIGIADLRKPENVETEGSFWDLDTSGIDNSRGGAGLPTEDMKTPQAFLDAGWDFEQTWMICEGEYPRLRWERIPCVE